MTVLRSDDLILPAVGKFGPCVVSVGFYDGRVNPGSPRDVAGMSDKERDKAAEWTLKALAKWGKDSGRTVADIRKQYFGGE